VLDFVAGEIIVTILISANLSFSVSLSSNAPFCDDSVLPPQVEDQPTSQPA
jgi:hypothetical protein